MRLKLNWKLVVVIILIIHFQHLFMFFSEVLGTGNVIKAKEFLTHYNPMYTEVGMMWFLPSSIFSLFIVPLFIYFYAKKNLKTLKRSLLLFTALIVLFYVIGFITMIFFEMKASNRYILYPSPLSLEKHIVFWGYLVGNIIFSLFFVPLWHYYLNKHFGFNE